MLLGCGKVHTLNDVCNDLPWVTWTWNRNDDPCSPSSWLPCSERLRLWSTRTGWIGFLLCAFQSLPIRRRRSAANTPAGSQLHREDKLSWTTRRHACMMSLCMHDITTWWRLLHVVHRASRRFFPLTRGAYTRASWIWFKTSVNVVQRINRLFRHFDYYYDVWNLISSIYDNVSSWGVSNCY